MNRNMVGCGPLSLFPAEVSQEYSFVSAFLNCARFDFRPFVMIWKGRFF